MTAMQELIDWTYHMEESIASITYTDADRRLLKQLREKFESFLPIEREQHSLSFDAGCAHTEKRMNEFNGDGPGKEEYLNGLFQ